MRTDLRSLEWLLAVAERGSIGAAARHLHVSQPSVTDRLQRLERHLGLGLLQRSPRGTQLTTEGAAVADWARQVLDASDRLEAGAAALRRQHDSRVRVSASMTVAEYLLPRWLSDLRQGHPGTTVALRMCNSREVTRDVAEGRADLGFVEGPRVDGDLRKRVIASDDLAVVVGPRHRWARRRAAVSVAQLVEESLVVREPGSGTRDTLELALARAGHGQALSGGLELGSTAAIKAAVLTGQGVGVLSRLAVADDLASGRLHEVPVAGLDLVRRLCMVWSPGQRLTGAPAELAAIALAAGKASEVLARGS
ncbi:MAG TPA: LysR family transcriptional regulator [Segeticoccus sp.]|uniref:LysR family transcriptional regulator n=1 Tax=Segeticoccus sp. TaxID=2706531 RepID=UPI002D807853|nr:LysR family transcriptional regulator [Segeticoccus sp.]HET8602151.1 LysR family transcriptional regulator [Segeticoccus sp.]